MEVLDAVARPHQRLLQGAVLVAGNGSRGSGGSRNLPPPCVLCCKRSSGAEDRVGRAGVLKLRKSSARWSGGGGACVAVLGSDFFGKEEGIFLTAQRAEADGRGRRSGRAVIRCQVAGAAVQGGGWDFTVPASKDASVWQKVRAICFYTTTLVIAAPLLIVMLVLHPFVMLFDKARRKAHHLVNKVWAQMTTFPFYKTEISGWENLPAEDEGAVYVANHQSFLDIFTLFQLGRPFKFISKTSNFLIPIIGWAMYLTGHVPLQREDPKSQIQCLRHCVELVKRGVPVIFFPEGTRSPDGAMAQFKKGAFSVAAKAKAPVVPISLIGTGKLMPNKMEYTLRPGLVKVVIHPPIRDNNPDVLSERARSVIAETLVKHGLPVH